MRYEKYLGIAVALVLFSACGSKNGTEKPVAPPSTDVSVKIPEPVFKYKVFNIKAGMKSYQLTEASSCDWELINENYQCTKVRATTKIEDTGSNSTRYIKREYIGNIEDSFQQEELSMLSDEDNKFFLTAKDKAESEESFDLEIPLTEMVEYLKLEHYYSIYRCREVPIWKELASLKSTDRGNLSFVLSNLFGFDELVQKALEEESVLRVVSFLEFNQANHELVSIGSTNSAVSKDRVIKYGPVYFVREFDKEELLTEVDSYSSKAFIAFSESCENKYAIVEYFKWHADDSRFHDYRPIYSSETEKKLNINQLNAVQQTTKDIEYLKSFRIVSLAELKSIYNLFPLDYQDALWSKLYKNSNISVLEKWRVQ